MHADVCVVRMEAGEQTTDTEVIVAVVVTVTVPAPNFVAFCVEVAVMVAVPAPVGVKTPEDVIVPPVAVQVTAELNAPVPSTVAVQADVCVVKIDAGEHTTDTEVIVGPAVTVTVAGPDFVTS